MFVAPNGFGKSSFAAAFNALNKKSLKLDSKEHFFENKESNMNKAKIEIGIVDIEDKKKILIADFNTNLISKEMDIFVINNVLTPKSKYQNFGSFHVNSKTVLMIPDIVLKNTIPKKKNFNYNFSKIKNDFGINGKILININSILKNFNLVIDIFSNEKFKKLDQVTSTRKLEEFNAYVNSLSGNVNEIKKEILNHYLQELEKQTNLKATVEILKKYRNDLNEIDLYCVVYQLYSLSISQKDKLNDIIKFYRYEKFKKEVSEIIKSLGGTWKGIKPQEVKGKLVIKFPDIRTISNGERDSISFLGNLLKIEEKLTKDVSFLIIDEVFDYLDDSNLLICQYYISKFIKSLKKAEKQVFPIIMTHLNPYYFKGFVFSDQKVHFLNKFRATVNKDLCFIIEKRNNSKIEDALDRYFLHYNIEEKDLSGEFESLNLNKSLGISRNFNSHIEKEFNKYLQNKIADPLSCCAYLRIKIEKYCYDKLNESKLKDCFIETHRTVEKLNFAKANGVLIPEIFYLLGIVYNDGLHTDHNEDWITPIQSKLENFTIKNMINEVVKTHLL
jgi:hypothetical protein